MTDPEIINAAIPQLPDDKEVKAMLARRAKALGFVWNGKQFAEKVPDAAE